MGQNRRKVFLKVKINNDVLQTELLLYNIDSQLNRLVDADFFSCEIAFATKLSEAVDDISSSVHLITSPGWPPPTSVSTE